MKKYNKEDRASAIQARRDAVLFLRRKKKYSFRSIGYAVGLTKWRAEGIYLGEMRRRGDTLCIHQWTSTGFLPVSGFQRTTLTCGKCGRIEYLSGNGKWVIYQPGLIPL